MRKIIFIIGLLAIGMASGQQHWGYDGTESPDHWSDIAGNEKCGKSKIQSPINIVTSKVISGKGLKKIGFNYLNSDIKDIDDNGHTLQFDFKEGSYVIYENKKYYLLQFHAHEESEHKIDGIRYPLELHFVHKALDGSILVLSTMVKEGRENSYFEKLKVFKNLAAKQKENTDIVFNPEKLYPKNKSYYRYTGSLTTPPCTDNVEWIVFKNPIEMTEDEIEEIAEHLPKNNNRPIQPINDRKVSIYNQLK